ncbi:LysR substrate-binding domain-containing protein [Variovorax sp. CAN2819]|uniref:LysR family transcriptional regulator n=1 Tax=Variovorax sp. CAN15 TaxID=3046727 RepID=UPI002647905F|nr:LysR substrate-binding domain-containing protein [Variovorax sp. CAN15]MDN6882384.1 LysR substrate-binding domain-containing protein [Variovorax sp. CAN15]
MELRHLRYFLALAERLSFTQAAVQLHVTQSTLSHQISQLENELGQKLFDRSARRVTLTAAGELFLPQAAKALAEIDVGIALIGAPEKAFEGTLSLGTTMTLNMGLVPKCLALFAHAHPSVRLVVEENTVDSLIADMRAGRLDLILAYRPLELEGLLFEPLYSEEMVVAVNQKHPFARRRRLRMVELHGRDLTLPARKYTTRMQIDEALRAAGAQPHVVVETSSIAGMLALVQQAPMATIVSRSALADHLGLVAIPLEGPSLQRTPGLLWPEGQVHTPTTAAFAAIVRRVAKSMEQA